jgi:hypothetical protein
MYGTQLELPKTDSNASNTEYGEGCELTTHLTGGLYYRLPVDLITGPRQSISVVCE